MAIKQSYKTELENINEITAVIEYYKSDLESALGKMQQDVDSPLFVSILRIVLANLRLSHPHVTHPRKWSNLYKAIEMQYLII